MMILLGRRPPQPSPPPRLLQGVLVSSSPVVLLLVMMMMMSSVIDGAAVQRRDAAGQQRPVVDWQAVGQEALNRALRLAKPNENVARNVILFLGDGMGVATVTAGRIYAAQANGQSGEEANLSFDEFPHVALAKTYNVNHQVPDSAGTATAFLSGVKANMGVVGVNQKVRRANCSDMVTDTNNNADSILRWSLNAGKRAGVVTTTRITHATPSASYAHSPDRDWESDGDVPSAYRAVCRDIASQLIDDNSDINVIMGGGRRAFLPVNGSVPNNGSRLDGRNLIQEWQAKLKDKSAVYVSNKNMLNGVNTQTTDYLLGLFNENHLKYRWEHLKGQAADEPTLADMTQKAIEILRRGNNGYFLLVEGGRIDHGHHAGIAKVALEEVVSFDEAVRRAVRMTDSKDTLIVVTADHSHTLSIGGYPSRGNPILGLVDELPTASRRATDGWPYLTLSYANGPGAAVGKARSNLTGVDTHNEFFSQQAIVPMASETHGGEDVAVYAVGPMSHLFHGVQEQHYVAHAMAYASCVGFNRLHCSAQQRNSAATDSQLTSSVSLAHLLVSVAAGLLVEIWISRCEV